MSLDGERQKGYMMLSRVMVWGGKGSGGWEESLLVEWREGCLKGATLFRPEGHVPNGADL